VALGKKRKNLFAINLSTIRKKKKQRKANDQGKTAGLSILCVSCGITGL
jgi:hypothetical protein